MTTLSLPYPISANRYWQTRIIKLRGSTKPTAMTYVSKEAQEYKALVAKLAMAAGVRTPIDGRVAVTYTLHPHRPLDAHRREKRDPLGWEDTVQCIDLDNAQKVLLDALKGVAFGDDKWVREIVAKRGEPVEGGKLVVTITPLAVSVAQAEQGDLLAEVA